MPGNNEAVQTDTRGTSEIEENVPFSNKTGNDQREKGGCPNSDRKGTDNGRKGIGVTNKVVHCQMRPHPPNRRDSKDGSVRKRGKEAVLTKGTGATSAFVKRSTGSTRRNVVTGRREIHFLEITNVISIGERNQETK